MQWSLHAPASDLDEPEGEQMRQEDVETNKYTVPHARCVCVCVCVQAREEHPLSATLSTNAAGVQSRTGEFGTCSTAELVKQIHRLQYQEHDDPPPYSKAVKLSTPQDCLPAPARTFSDILERKNKLEEDGLLKTSSKRTPPFESDSELNEASDTRGMLSNILRQSGATPRQSDAGVLGSFGCTYVPDENGVKLRRKKMTAAANQGTDDIQTEPQLNDPVAIDVNVEAQAKPRTPNRWRGVILTIRGMLY
ncbi:hypothetical protein P171DRAFT_442195 [Karstenula rhodostoma CBS 690.94]|uniref:Uncharacterized protein n=1 Tax=Karstenula rhodostoma CBS 690.94 TaxID=1392251 RepID=A0A9P4UF91_9PLEO|nr:hypothetical protein P171DRAFT_442195 [Karstenula rhodostoma CBS 690.94]